ncbi:protein kinase domain-containing protein [Pseudoduganella namucuonensis]|uniref:non-specific serine/threonine protein kinase n=1 Tax=Pseudoduganella namucuonensis TaxID=1035707 RepID=A0A1I7L4V7_9BURK|nr:cache domain-containing protein [Pseudoduganella namucuonensis]SFV04668.1 Serine/threonine protein kinase [Pseudoduganella namucuonensis]
MEERDQLNEPDDGNRNAAAEARAAILARRVAALEAVVAVERRMRDVHEMTARAATGQLAARDGLADITVPRPQAAQPHDDDATIPVPYYRPDGTREPPRHRGPAEVAARAQGAVPAEAAAPTSGDSPTEVLNHPHSRPSVTGRTRSASQPSRSNILPTLPPIQNRSIAPGTASPLALAPGFELFEYRIDSVLGQGGFGITYLATDVNLNAKVAIKEYLPADFATRASDKSVSPRWPEDNEFYLNGLECFLVEARTLATFRHSNIVRVARFFEAHRTAYMVLEYEQGKPLKQWWEKHKDMPEQQLLSLMQPLLDGLSLVHESGYLHRDIKPDNIYVRKDDGSLVLLDFGAARQTVGGMQAMADVVTPGYAPLEQYEGGEQGPWTDIYAFGATLYWMITGAKPAPAPERRNGVAEYIPATQAAAGRYSEEFLKAVDWALEVQPAQRPQSIQEFSQSLFASHAGSLGLQEALRVGELEGQRSIKKGVRKLGRALWRPASWPLVVKMTIAMMLAALLPMTITAYYNLRGSVSAVSASELRNLESLAQATAGRISQLIADSRYLANYLATDRAFIEYLREPTEARKAVVSAKLDNLIKTNPDAHLMFLMDKEGTALVSSEPGVAGVNFKFREYFREAMKGQPFMTGVIIGATAGLPGVYYANPVFDEAKNVIGVVVLRIKGATISAILNEVGSDRARVPFMIDGDGVIVHHPDARQLYRSLAPLPKATLGRIIADQRFRRHRIESVDMPDLAQALIGARSTGNISFHSTLSGVDEHAGYAPVKGHNWIVGVSESRTRFEEPLQRLFSHVLYSVAAVGLVFLILAVLFARSITRPVVRLTEAANALKDGDYDRANIKVTSTDEIGRLARTFNVMIDVLRQREREKRRTPGRGREEE